MASDVATINKSLSSIDISGLLKYTNKIKDIGSLSKTQASFYMQDFIQAIDMTNTMLMICIRLDLDAQSLLKTAEAIAYLENAPEYLQKKGLKESDGSRKMYIDIDPNVLEAKSLKARTEATVAFLKNKLSIFSKCHDDVKKIGYADQRMTNFEGF